MCAPDESPHSATRSGSRWYSSARLRRKPIALRASRTWAGKLASVDGRYSTIATTYPRRANSARAGSDRPSACSCQADPCTNTTSGNLGPASAPGRSSRIGGSSTCRCRARPDLRAYSTPSTAEPYRGVGSAASTVIPSLRWVLSGKSVAQDSLAAITEAASGAFVMSSLLAGDPRLALPCQPRAPTARRRDLTWRRRPRGPGHSFQVNRTSRFRNVGGPSHRAAICAANASVSGRAEFSIAASYESNSMMLR